MVEPQDMFEFVETHQDEINALGPAIYDFLKGQNPNPYVALVALSDVVSTIIERNFQFCTDVEHLKTLTEQMLEGYTNTIMSAAEGIMRARFNRSFNDEDEIDDYAPPIGSC